MRITKRLRIGRFQASLMMGLVTKVHGINSGLISGEHIIMWEFDEADPAKVQGSLLDARNTYNLPEIHLARSHPGGGFHAYCFKAMSFIETLHIVTGTAYVDPNYITMCAMRQHWTLRLTDKGQGQPEHYRTIIGNAQPDCSFMDLAGVVQYAAYQKGRMD